MGILLDIARKSRESAAIREGQQPVNAAAAPATIAPDERGDHGEYEVLLPGSLEYLEAVTEWANRFYDLAGFTPVQRQDALQIALGDRRPMASLDLYKLKVGEMERGTFNFNEISPS